MAVKKTASKSSAHAVNALKTSPVRQKTPSATGQGGRPGQYQGMTAIEPTRVTVGARPLELSAMPELPDAAANSFIPDNGKSEAKPKGLPKSFR